MIILNLLDGVTNLGLIPLYLILPSWFMRIDDLFILDVLAGVIAFVELFRYREVFFGSGVLDSGIVVLATASITKI